LKESHAKVTKDLQEIQDEIDEIRNKYQNNNNNHSNLSHVQSNYIESTPVHDKSVKRSLMHSEELKYKVELSDQILVGSSTKNNTNVDIENIILALKNGQNKSSLNQTEQELVYVFENLKKQVKTNVKSE